MPHIAIEVSPPLLAAVDWAQVLQAMHVALAERGWARMEDLKSRVMPIAVSVCGLDLQAQQLIATLTLTNRRPPQTSDAMAALVFDHMSGAIDMHPGLTFWVQCCVFLQEHPKPRYLKRQWNAPRFPAI